MAISTVQVNLNPPPTPDSRGLKIIAKSIYRELRTQGYDAKQVVGLATELISLVTTELEKDPAR